MHKKSQFIVFISLILFLFNMANAADITVPATIYVVDKGNHSIYSCVKVPGESREECNQLPLRPEIRPNYLVSTARDIIVYIASERNAIIKATRNRDNTLTPLKIFSDPLFKAPISMATYPVFPFRRDTGYGMATQIYILNRNDNDVLVCDILTKDMPSESKTIGDFISCRKALTLISPARSITISANNRYAYLAMPFIQKIMRCNINPLDKTLNECAYYNDPWNIITPSSLAADPVNNFIYYLDSSKGNRGFSMMDFPDNYPSYKHFYLLSGITSYNGISTSTISMSRETYIDDTTTESNPYRTAYIGMSRGPLIKCKINNHGQYILCRQITEHNFTYVTSILPLQSLIIEPVIRYSIRTGVSETSSNTESKESS